MSYYPALVEEALMQVKYPGTGKNIVESGILEDDIRIEGRRISFSLILKKNDPFAKSLIKAAEMAIVQHLGPEVDICGNISVKTKEVPVSAVKEKALSQVKHVIAVASGKGGVGKSTVAVNLAIALVQAGYRVGLLDADVYGPSIPTMFGLEGVRPIGEEVDGKSKVKPVDQYGVKVLSMGFFVDREQALIWRGAMAHNAIKQLIHEANWGELDYLLIDLPPGTGDIHLSITNELSLSGAIIVSTPQEVALADVVKGVNMFQNKNIQVPIIGMIENMAFFTPKELPDHKYHIFGEGGVARLAEELKVPLLGQIPIRMGVREGGDKGVPYAMGEEEREYQDYQQVAKAVIQYFE